MRNQSGEEMLPTILGFKFYLLKSNTTHLITGKTISI